MLHFYLREGEKMRKKIILILVLCFITITFSGCSDGAYKLSSFDGISLKQLKNGINKNTQSYNITVPDFQKFEASNGYSILYDCTSVIIEVKPDGSQEIAILLDKEDVAASDIIDKNKQFIIIAYGVIAAIEPNIDPSELIASLLDQNQARTSEYNYSYLQDDRLVAFIISK